MKHDASDRDKARLLTYIMDVRTVFFNSSVEEKKETITINQRGYKYQPHV